MPSLGDALAAVVTRACEGGVDGENSVACLPDHRFPLSSEALAGDGSPPSFNFIVRANMVPRAPPRFSLSSTLVWEVFGDVLDTARLLPNIPDDAGYATQFAAAAGRFALNAQQPANGLRFYKTFAMPSDLGDGWTTFALGAEAIAAQAGAAEPWLADWLTGINTLPSMGSGLIASLRLEMLELVIMRPWFAHEILALRCWTIDGEAVSDGGDPPHGRMPYVPTRMVLLRNFTVELSAERLPRGARVIYRAAPGSEAAANPAPEPRDWRKLLEPLTRPPFTPQPLTADGPPLADQIAGAAAAVEEDAASTSGSETTVDGGPRFHVPFAFDCTQARQIADTDLAEAQQRLGALEQQLIGHEAAAASWRDKLSSLGAQGGWFGAVGLKKVLAAKLHMQLARQAEEVAQLQGEIETERAEVAQCQGAVAALELLQAVPGSSEPHVLLVGCERMPKSPDPDLAFL